MERILSGLPNLQIREAKGLRDDDFVDQLHHYVTVYMFAFLSLIIGLKEYAGAPLDCYVTAYIWKHFQEHVNVYCWTHKLYRFPNPYNLSQVVLIIFLIFITMPCLVHCLCFSLFPPDSFTSMEALISGIPNLKLKEQIREDDFVDQLHHFVTVYLLAAFAVIMALKEFASSPLDCWFTNQTWKHFQDHANFYCWTHKLYRYPNPDNLAEVPYELSPEHGGPKNQTIVDTEDLGQINFYRWITVIFLCQAFMFKLPNLLWNECNEYSGTQIEKMVTMIGGTSFDSKEKKDITFSGVAEYVEIWLKVNRKPFSFMRTRVGRQTKKILSHCMLCVGANTGNYLSTMYLVVKFLFLINILGQFLILTAFLRFNFWQYGAKAMMIYEENEERMDNVHFPRVALCHFQVKGQGSWIQCLLTINMLLEKLFVMEWFWLFLLLLLTIYSLFAWIVRILRTDYSVQFVTKYLSIFNEDGSLPHEGKRTVLTFVRDYLGNDGIFMLRILAVNTNDVVMAELICHMWKRYTEYHYKEPVMESGVDTDPLNEDESEKKDDSAGPANGTKDGKTVDGTTGNEKPNQVAPDVYHIA